MNETGPRPVILTTIEHTGAMWTVCLHVAENGAAARRLTLSFVRDWIVGGTRRYFLPVEQELADILTSCSGERIEQRLREELERAIQFARLNPRVVCAGLTDTRLESH